MSLPSPAVHFEVVTLFPELMETFAQTALVGRAATQGLAQVGVVPLREFGLGKHRQVDDVPYGGGAGMVLRPEPLFAATRNTEQRLGQAAHKVLITPQGQPFRQAKAQELSRLGRPIMLFCGRYEGFDERVRTGLADEEISLGDFVALGGEAAAMLIMEAVIRLVPGVLGNPTSSEEESFSGPWLEYPQYTRPPEFEGMAVPEVLLSGHHGEIEKWRRAQSQERTRQRRPDLLPQEALPTATGKKSLEDG